MSWKRAVFFGGAVLLLAACDNATAPTSPSGLTRLGGAPSALKAKDSDTSVPAATSDSTTTGISSECNGSVIFTGLDVSGVPVLVCVPNQIIW